MSVQGNETTNFHPTAKKLYRVHFCRILCIAIVKRVSTKTTLLCAVVVTTYLNYFLQWMFYYREEKDDESNIKLKPLQWGEKHLLYAKVSTYSFHSEWCSLVYLRFSWWCFIIIIFIVYIFPETMRPSTILFCLCIYIYMHICMYV